MNEQTNCIDRTKGIGGSDIPAVLGLSPFKTPFELYLEKTGEKDYEPNIEPEARRRLELGRIIEPFAIEQFEEEHRVKVTRRQEHIISPAHNFLWATIDGVCENCVVEVKTTSSHNSDWKNQVPIYVLAQATYYAKLANSAGFKIVVFFRDTGAMRVYDFARDGDLEQQIISGAVGFWETVQNRIPPEPVSYDELQQRFKEVVADKKITATPSDVQKLARMRALKNEIAEKEQEYEELKVHICKMMGDVPVITDENGNVLAAWSPRSAIRVSMEMLKTGFRDVYEKCKVKTTTRNFCLKGV